MRLSHSIMVSSGIGFTLGLALALGAGSRFHGTAEDRMAPDTGAVHRAEVVYRDDLPDAGMAVFDPAGSRIYLNPVLLARVGPDLAAFLYAHEQGHVAYHHVSERRFGLVRVETPVPVLHGYEIAADCFAAQTLRRTRPMAVRAALRFFQRHRELTTDAAHPSMGARADSLLDCLTNPRRRLR